MKPKDLSFLDIAFLRHDPTTQTLVLYNNNQKSIKEVRLEAINTEKQAFHKDFEKLGPRTGIIVPMSELSDGIGTAFSGQLHKIVLHHNTAKTSFTKDNKKFKRTS